MRDRRVPFPHEPTEVVLAELLRRHRERILEEWEREVRRLPEARALPRPVLRDDIPPLLDRIAELAATRSFHPDDLTEAPEAHALHRLDVGFDLTDVLREYGALRSTLLRVLQAEDAGLTTAELVFVNEAIDRAVTNAAETYARVRQRMLAALDRMSSIAFAGGTLVSSVLDGFVTVLLESAAVDAAAVFLFEGEMLRVRASRGPGAPAPGATLLVGEGFAGRVAGTRSARSERGQEGFTALYGIPLVVAGSLVGVAQMGSLSSHEFSEEDRVVFRSMASRAALVLAHALLEARERAANAAARAVASAGTVDEAITALLREIGTSFRWDIATFWKRGGGVGGEGEGERLEAVEWWTAPDVTAPRFREATKSFRFAIGEGLPGRAWRAGRAVWVSDVRGDPQFPRRDAATVDGLHSALAFPLQARGRTLGIAEFFSRAPRAPVEEGVQLTRAVAGTLETFLDRLAQREAVQRSEAHKAALFDTALDCIITMDASGTITAWNPAAERTFGWTAEEVIGRELAEVVIPPSLRDAHRRGLARYLQSRRGTYLDRRLEFSAVRRGGDEFPVELTITRIPGEPPTFTGYVRDITDRKRYEVELQDAVRVRDEVLAIVSHDLRNPLNTINISTAMLEAHADAPARKTLETVRRAAGQMRHLIDDLLDMASVHAGRLRVEAAPIAVETLLSEAFALHELAFTSKGIRLAREITGGDLELLADRTRVFQALSNLLGNALKFCRAGDLVTLGARPADRSVELFVRDTGPGIAADDLARIFDPYWSARRHERKGTGLGLFITKGIVEAHGGRIRVESTVGQGTTMAFTLPLAPA